MIESRQEMIETNDCSFAAFQGMFRTFSTLFQCYRVPEVPLLEGSQA